MTISALTLENYLKEIKAIVLKLKSEGKGNEKVTRILVREELCKSNKLTKEEANALINEFIRPKK
tara:strand:- start:318 stop:512 length:195 start_codon:yes stop_codon:yes gene_type:complete